MRYSGFKVVKQARTRHKGWMAAWRDPEKRLHYEIFIIRSNFLLDGNEPF